jgi:hypothetical protein
MQRWRGCLHIIGYFAELQEQHAVSEDCPGCMRRDRDRLDDAEDVQVSTRAKVEPDEGGRSRGKQRRLFEQPCLRSNGSRLSSIWRVR